MCKNIIMLKNQTLYLDDKRNCTTAIRAQISPCPPRTLTPVSLVHRETVGRRQGSRRLREDSWSHHVTDEEFNDSEEFKSEKGAGLETSWLNKT